MKTKRSKEKVSKQTNHNIVTLGVAGALVVDVLQVIRAMSLSQAANTETYTWIQTATLCGA
jgi:hypothetical protein